MIIVICIFILSVFIITRFFLFGKDESSCKSIQDIPCPEAVPILGNVLDMFCSDEEIWKITRKRALKYYPIYRLQVFNSNVVCLHHPEDIEQILSSNKHINKSNMYNTMRKLTGNGLIVNHGESWKKRRKLLTKNFHFAALPKYITVFNKEVRMLVEGLQQHVYKSTNLLEPISHSTMKIINEILVGEDLKLPESEIKSYVSAIETVSRVIGYKNSKPIISLAYNYSQLKKEEDKALKLMETFTKGVLKNWKMKTDDSSSILDTMIEAREIYNGKDIKDEINTFIFAGNSTSSAGLLFALLVLANRPHYQEEIYQEIVQIVGDKDEPSYADLTSMNFLDRFIKESLRLYPPAPFLGRMIDADIVTKTGYKIPAGTPVVINIFDIHRSPYIYENPEIFDPDRFLPEKSKDRHPFSYIPFSAGPRNCIAQKFVLLEIKISICQILKKFKLEPVTLMEDIIFIPDVTLATKQNIKVKLIDRL